MPAIAQPAPDLASSTPGLDSPCPDGVAITPDNVDLARAVRCIYVGVTGDVQIITPNGTTLLFKNVPQGTTLPWMAKQVMSTNTTATNLIGGF